MHVSCTICTELYQANEETVITKCGHLFHTNCVKPWLLKNKTCPHCRAASSVNDLIRVFFTEISDEDVHLNRNCKIDSLQALLASEKEHMNKINLDLRQSKNDLIDMSKHIEIYENEIINLQNLNESLLENNEKIELEIKNLNEKFGLSESELKKLKKIYNSLLENKEKIDIENKKLNKQSDGMPANKVNRQFSSSETSEVEYENLYGSNSISYEDVLDIVELKTIIASYEEALIRSTNDNQFLQKQNNIVIIRNEELELELHHLKDEKKKNEILALKYIEIEKERINVNQQKVNLSTTSVELKPLKLQKRNESLNKNDVKRLDQYLKNLKKQQIINSKNLESESTISKQSTTESIQSVNDKLTSITPNSVTNNVKKFENNKASSFNTYKGKLPMPPPRILKPVSSLRRPPLIRVPCLTPIRAPFPPPRKRNEKPTGRICNTSSYSLPIQPKIMTVNEHPLTLNSITRSRSADPITLLGLVINERNENTSGSNETTIQTKKEEKSSTLNNESNA